MKFYWVKDEGDSQCKYKCAGNTHAFVGKVLGNYRCYLMSTITAYDAEFSTLEEAKAWIEAACALEAE